MELRHAMAVLPDEEADAVFDVAKKTWAAPH
jgi:hypothetical protein